MNTMTLQETRTDVHEVATFSSIGVITLVFLIVICFKLISEFVNDIKVNIKEKNITLDIILSGIFATILSVVVLTGIAGFIYCIKEQF